MVWLPMLLMPIENIKLDPLWGHTGLPVVRAPFQTIFFKVIKKSYQKRPFGSQVLTRSYDETDLSLRNI